MTNPNAPLGDAQQRPPRFGNACCLLSLPLVLPPLRVIHNILDPLTLRFIKKLGNMPTFVQTAVHVANQIVVRLLHLLEDLDGWSVGRLVGWSGGRLVGWSRGRVVGWSGGRVVG